MPTVANWFAVASEKPKRGNPQMQKGAPSMNPAGRGAPTQKAKRAAGSDGVVAYSGYISEAGEGSSKLIGREKWITYANAFHHPAPAIALLLRRALLSGVKWSLTENPAGGALAKRGVEIVDAGLLKARLPKPWSKVVSKAAMHYFFGFSLHAAALVRRPDGMVVFADLAHRPQHTIEKWWRKDSQSPWSDVEQKIDGDAVPYTIPLDECFYLVNDMLSDSPTGTGVLRLVVERLRRIGNYEGVEGHEIFNSMGGTPVYRAPFSELAQDAPTGSTAEQKQEHVTKMTQTIRNAVVNRIKTPEKQQYLGLDSATYTGTDENKISNVKKWDIEIIKGQLQGLPEIRKVINDGSLDVARILNVEFVFIGGNDSSGTYGMSESKIDLFATALQSDLTQLAECADQQLVRRLILANGLDPDVAAPSLTPSKITGKDVERVARALGLVQMAALPPNHPAKIALFEAMELPWVDEDEGELLAPRKPTKPGQREREDVDPADPEKREDIE